MATMPLPELGSFLDEAQIRHYASHANPEAAYYIDLIAAGNSEARQLMWAVWDFEHLYDDLVDGDRPVSTEDAAKVLIAFVKELSFNSFWREHAQDLFPLLVSAANRWCDGDEWALSEDPTKQAQAPVVRCGDVDFFLQVAYCVGGWEHMRAVKAAREYDKE